MILTHRVVPIATGMVSVVLLLAGCGPSTTAPPVAEPQSAQNPAARSNSVADPLDPPAAATLQPVELDVDRLMAATLPIEEATEGWIRLFDGQTTFGWQIVGDANFHVQDQQLIVDSGDNCLMCTTTRWRNFDLTLEFQAEEQTNSGVFVRTPLVVTDPVTQCYEVNIAPPSNPFPTGSVVGRKKATTFAADGDWHRMDIHCQDSTLTVGIDGQELLNLDDADDPSVGHIGLQHNAGRVAFRDIRLRPLGFESLLDDELSLWNRPDDQSGTIELTQSGLEIQGGKQYLESRDRYDDFTLLANYRMKDASSNSGIFFRCVPGESMNGYECQVNDSLIEDDRLRPADGGTGGIFRRADARLVAGTPGQDNVVLCHVAGPHVATWVNGLQVTDMTDTRSADPNPRRGLRTEAGTLQLQGHDETTRVTYGKLQIIAP